MSKTRAGSQRCTRLILIIDKQIEMSFRGEKSYSLFGFALALHGLTLDVNLLMCALLCFMVCVHQDVQLAIIGNCSCQVKLAFLAHTEKLKEEEAKGMP